MSFSHFIHSGGKLLRCGYTTGTCAALAAAAAAHLLLCGERKETMSIRTPKGITVTVPVALTERTAHGVRCGVVKDGGDDSDCTDGLMVCAEVRKCAGTEMIIDGGEGVGRVTKKGLDQPVGAAAINRVPRAMIEDAVRRVCDSCGYSGALEVTISIPGGAEAAKRTFNPMLGVEGGLSVLGTSGIVEPMSERAIVDTIAIEVRQKAAEGHRDIVFTPGNYGEAFLRGHSLYRKAVPVVKCSNFIGETLDIAVAEGFANVLLVGHIGKFVKLSGGLMNTHSRYGDCRTELFCAHAAVCGASRALCGELMGCATADACIAALDREHLRGAVLARLADAAARRLRHRAGETCRVGAVFFSNEYGLLAQTEEAKEIVETWQ